MLRNLACLVILTHLFACSGADFQGNASRQKKPGEQQDRGQGAPVAANQNGGSQNTENQGAPGTLGGIPSSESDPSQFGSHPSFDASNPSREVATIGCQGTLRLSKKGASSLAIDGSLCMDDPVPQELHVALALDGSASMAGNDPECQRFGAAEKVLSALAGQKGRFSKILVSLVRFDLVSKIVLSPKALDDVQLGSLKSQICGGFGGSNHGAAFLQIGQIFKDTPGAIKVVYLVSDGMPTIGDSGGYKCQQEDCRETLLEKVASQAVVEAQKLRLEYRATVNSLYLFPTNNTGSQLSIQRSGQFLEQVSSSPKHVRLAKNPGALGAEIENFAPPKPANLGPKDVQVTLTLGAEVFTFVIASLEFSENKWVFSTKDLPLSKGLDSTTPGSLKVQVARHPEPYNKEWQVQFVD